MGRRLRMTAELGDWLTELGESQPAAAAEVAAALVAVIESAALPGLAILGEPAALRSPDQRERADLAYQRLLEELQHFRRRVSEVATRRKRYGLRLDAERAAGADAARLAELERDLAADQHLEEQLTLQSQRFQSEVDAYRTAKETAKAVYTAADARLRIAEALEAIGGEPDEDLDRLREDLRVAALKLEDVQSGVVRQVTGRDTAHAPGTPAPGLLELRADPLGSDIRILLAIEPADTVTLLAVLDGPQAVTEHGAQAVKLASDLLTEIRDDGWPSDIDEVTLADADAFLARYVPADDGSITHRAGVLAEACSLGVLRADQQLTTGQLAAKSGLDADRVEEIEREGLRTATVSEALALARALGARLELLAGSGPVLAD